MRFITTLATALLLFSSGSVSADPPLTSQAVTYPYLPTTWVPGDCDSVANIFRAYGATEEEVEFFIDRGVVWRESGCGLNTVNPNTSDRGICQINGIHRRPGYFWGESYGEGGWTAQFGIYNGTDPDSPIWVQACLFLYRVEGSSPWRATR